MAIKIFAGKKINIRKLANNDLKKVKKFQNFINSLIVEEAKILLNKKISLKEEKKFIESKLKDIKSRKEVFLVAEDNGRIAGTTAIELGAGRKNHIGEFGITIRRECRGIGLGKYMMGEILKLAKEELKPKPKIIRLSAYPNNKPAISLYKKYGFKIVAKIPKQIQFKRRFIDELIMLLGP